MELEKRLFMDDIKERYRCGDKRARAIMREMEHMERPLSVTVKAVAEYEAMKTVRGSLEVMEKAPLRVVANRRPPKAKESETKYAISRKRPAVI